MGKLDICIRMALKSHDNPEFLPYALCAGETLSFRLRGGIIDHRFANVLSGLVKEVA